MYVFVMDMVVGFLTSYINVSSGEEVFGLKYVAINYICHGTFIIDFLSTFPMEHLVKPLNNDGLTMTFKVLGFLKVQRLRRISKIIGQLNSTQETKALFKVVYMVFGLIMYIHILACILWLTFNSGKTWVPAVDFIYAETKLFREEYPKQYLSMCYHAIMVFGLNEVAPVT